jgi:hypothetical protein
VPALDIIDRHQFVLRKVPSQIMPDASTMGDMAIKAAGRDRFYRALT